MLIKCVYGRDNSVWDYSWGYSISVLTVRRFLYLKAIITILRMTVFPQSELQGMAFDMGFGVFYSHKYFYAGLSSTHLTEPVITFDEKYETYTGRSYYFIAGGNIPLKMRYMSCNPRFLLKTTFQITQVELTARLRYNKFLWGIVLSLERCAGDYDWC